MSDDRSDLQVISDQLSELNSGMYEIVSTIRKLDDLLDDIRKSAKEARAAGWIGGS